MGIGTARGFRATGEDELLEKFGFLFRGRFPPLGSRVHGVELLEAGGEDDPGSLLFNLFLVTAARHDLWIVLVCFEMRG